MPSFADCKIVFMSAILLVSGGISSDNLSAQFPTPIPNRGGMTTPVVGGSGGMAAAGAAFERPVRSSRVRIQPQDLLAVAISSDGSRVAAGGEAALMIFDGSDGHALSVIDRGHDERINAVAFSRDGRWLASGGPARSVEIDRGSGFTYRMEGGIINLWEVSSGRRLASIDPRNAADALKFAPNGDLIASASGTRCLSAWVAGSDRPAALDEIRRIDLSGHFYDQLPVGTSFSDRGDRVAHCFPGYGTMFLREASEAGVRTLPYGNRPAAVAVAVSGDGGKLAVIGFDQSLTVWDFAGMTLEREVPLPRRHETIGRPTLLAFDPSGKSIASGGEDGIVRIWEDGGDQPSRTIYGPRLPVRAIAFLNRGLRVVSGGWAVLPPASQGVSNLVIWDVASPPQP